MGMQGIIKRLERFDNAVNNVPTAYINTLKMNEYLLVLNPHEEVRNRIMHIKEGFAEKFQAPFAKYLKPHITLVNFIGWASLEEKIMQRMHQVAMGTTPFKVKLKDYGSFPAHTIYINVATKIPIVSLVKELRSMQRLMKADPRHDPHFITEPHMTVARKLVPWQYEKGWAEYSQRHFTGKFIADGMLLLKRPLGEKSYQIAGRLEFQNLPVSIKQASLF